MTKKRGGGNHILFLKKWGRNNAKADHKSNKIKHYLQNRKTKGHSTPKNFNYLLLKPLSDTGKYKPKLQFSKKWYI